MPPNKYCLLAAVALMGCATDPPVVERRWPIGVEGYICQQFRDVAGGQAFVSATPNYSEGGYYILTTGWRYERRDLNSLQLHLSSYDGPNPALPRSSVSIGQVLRPGPRAGAWMYMRLSSGEVVGREFNTAAAGGGGALGGLVSSDSPAFVDAFTRAEWVDIDIVDPDGSSLLHTRVDLAGLPEAMSAMAQLRTQAVDDLTDYQHRCTENLVPEAG